MKEVLGDEFEGVLVSDFYGGYNAHLGSHQRRWVHLPRDIHELKDKHPDDRQLKTWAQAVKTIYEEAKGYKGANRRLGPVEQKAERVRHLVVSRKISGGTRSETGSETKSILASLFGTWRLQGLDFYQSCLNLLTAQNPTLLTVTTIRLAPRDEEKIWHTE